MAIKFPFQSYENFIIEETKKIASLETDAVKVKTLAKDIRQHTEQALSVMEGTKKEIMSVKITPALLILEEHLPELLTILAQNMEWSLNWRESPDRLNY